MPEIKALFGDTRTVRIERPDAVWFIRGVTNVDRCELERLADSGEGEKLCLTHGDALAVRITTGPRPVVTAWKALFSSHDLYWSIRPTGDIVMADQFRNALSMLPIPERAPNALTLAAHYMALKQMAPLTMSGSVERLENATHLEIDATAGTHTKHIFDRIPDDAVKRPRDEYVAALDAALWESFDEITDPASTAMLFSGGVDSTLVFAARPDLMQPLTFVPTTPEFAEETAYARRAAALLGVELDEIVVPEDGLLAGLATATETSGVPCYDTSEPFFHHMFEHTPYTAFVAGHGADSAFGSGLRLARFANAFRFTPSRQIVGALAPRTGGHLGYRLGQISAHASGFARDPWDPDGWAAETRSYAVTPLVQQVIDNDDMRAVRSHELDFVRQRSENVGNGPNDFLAHLEISHWMVVLNSQMWESRLGLIPLGKQAIGPYCDWRVLNALATVPVEDRYIVGMRGKWLLKELLASKVPDYPINQRKKATALPWQRYYTDGPLAGVWDEYDVPDVFSGEHRRQMIEEPDDTTWSAISYALWERHVEKNPNLTPMGVVEAYSAPIG